MKKLKVYIQGIEGRMGLELKKEIKVSKRVLISPELDSKKVDVVIDFSSPQGLVDIMQWCVKNKKPLVTGTTGLNKKEIILLKKGSKNIPIFWSPNMSLGVNIFFQVAEILAQKLMPKEILIQEVHHKHKKDKPSGTAKRLAEKLKAIKGTKVKKIESKRVGEVFGIHRVIFKTSGDQLTLEHSAKDRRIFAQGALEAAQWIQNKKTGLYNSEDFLKRKSL